MKFVDIWYQDPWEAIIPVKELNTIILIDMRQTQILILLWLFSISSFGQDHWEKKEHQLLLQWKEGQISSKMVHLKMEKEAGKIANRLKAWYIQAVELDNPANSGISLSFITDSIDVAESTSEYLKMTFINDTDKALTIQRFDATIGGVQEFFFIDGIWVVNREKRIYICGNSYFQKKLKPFSQLDFKVRNRGLIPGEIEVDYKIVMAVEDEKYESSVIKVKLYENQYKRLKQN